MGILKKWSKRILTGLLAFVLVIGSMTITPKTARAAIYADRGAYGVGEGKKIPDHIFAPFVDIVSYVSDKDYSSAGTLSLEKMYKDTGILYYNLGFIMTTATGGITDGVIDWSWGGYSTLGEKATDTWQIDGIKESIKYIRSKGGDVIVSIGGLNEGNFFQKTQDEDILYNSYMDVIQGYGLTRLDLDIEGGAQGKQINIANAKALKRVQETTGVEIVLTLPVLPTGLTDLGLGTLEAYVENGVDIKMVNIMAMCYGDATILPGETYAGASVRAIDNTANQILSTYRNNGKSISSSEAYGKVGVTVSIGKESASFPIWTTEYSKVVNDKAIKENIGMTSFWCLNRDCQQYGANKGITGMYEHTKVFKTFMGDNAYTIPPAGSDDDYVLDGEVIKEWKKGTAYYQGDKVLYDGKIWQASWWTQGDTPGVATDNGSEPWKYLQDATGSENPTEQPTEKTTEPEITQPEKTDVKLEINGYQISTTKEGYRVIYSFEDSNSEVETVGLIYGLSVNDSDMVIESSNSAVVNYQASDAGRMEKNYSSYSKGQSYAMTMTFIKNVSFYNSNISVRAYAKLKNGNYVYGDVNKIKIYDIADYLYQNALMSNNAGHTYLYDNILKVVNENYKKTDFNYKNIVVK